jgi:hypothetical protein
LRSLKKSKCWNAGIGKKTNAARTDANLENYEIIG